MPAIKDRVAQTAAVVMLEPIFEGDLPPEQYAYRSYRSALDAVRHVHKLLNTGHGQMVDADLSGYCDSIPHAELLKSVARRVVDGAMLHLIKMWLEAPVEETDEQGKKHRSTRTVPLRQNNGVVSANWPGLTIIRPVHAVSIPCDAVNLNSESESQYGTEVSLLPLQQRYFRSSPKPLFVELNS